MHNSGLSTDAKHCGVQAGYEKGLKVMAAVATGADLVSGGFGFLDSSSTFSLSMVPVDAEIAGMARRMARGIEITPETLMADSFARVGIGGDFLREKETRAPRARGRALRAARSARGCRSSSGSRRAARRSTRPTTPSGRRSPLASERGPRLTDDQRRELADGLRGSTT